VKCGPAELGDVKNTRVQQAGSEGEPRIEVANFNRLEMARVCVGRNHEDDSGNAGGVMGEFERNLKRRPRKHRAEWSSLSSPVETGAAATERGSSGGREGGQDLDQTSSWCIAEEARQG